MTIEYSMDVTDYKNFTQKDLDKCIKDAVNPPWITGIALADGDHIYSRYGTYNLSHACLISELNYHNLYSPDFLQGYILSDGSFVGRHVAKKIAIIHNQTDDKNESSILYSYQVNWGS